MSAIEDFAIVVLAGGLATRLRPMTTTLPKSMIEIAGQPFIYHQLKYFEQQGLRQVVICLGFLGEQVQQYIEAHQQYFNLDIKFSYDGTKLLGTAGAIKKIIPQLTDNFFVIYGDSYLKCNFNQVKDYFLRSNKLALMTVYKNRDQGDNSNVIFCDGQIICYDKINRTSEMHYIDYGLGIFNKKAFAAVPTENPYDLAMLYQELLAQKQLAGFEVYERFYEIGSFQGIEEIANVIN